MFFISLLFLSFIPLSPISLAHSTKTYKYSHHENNSRETAKNFENNGIASNTILFTDAAASGVALITVDKEGRNSIVIAAGANDSMSPSELHQFRDNIKYIIFYFTFFLVIIL